MNTRLCGLVALSVFLSSHAVGQEGCGTWLHGDGVRGTDGDIFASILWDPDGPGPRTPVVVLGGSFAVAGNIAASNIATWDPASDEWSLLGAGFDGKVRALAVLPNGDLVAGGEFSKSGDAALAGIARWDGQAWSSVGSGVGISGGVGLPNVHALAVAPNGDLYAGGEFTAAGGVPSNRIARWDGVAWSAIGEGIPSSGSIVRSICIPVTGKLCVGGTFSRAGTITARNIALWSGSAWTALSTGMGSDVYGVAARSSGEIIAVGSFITAGGKMVNRIASWNGTTWNAFAGGITGAHYQLLAPSVRSLTILANGDIAVGGTMYVSGFPAENSIFIWNGSTWQRRGSLIGNSNDTGSVLTLTELPDGSLFAGGQFRFLGMDSVFHAARVKQTECVHIGRGMDRPVLSFAELQNGRTIAGGYFTCAGNETTSSVAGSDGVAWRSLGAGVSGSISLYAPWCVKALLALPNGDVIAGGQFTQAGGLASPSIARWNGEQWSALGSGINGTFFGSSEYCVSALALLHSGDIVAAGLFTTADGLPANCIARYDGTHWYPLGSGVDGRIYALAVLPNGDLVAGGEFANAGGVGAAAIARWDGQQWSQFGGGTKENGFPSVRALLVAPNGDLIAGGQFSVIGTTSARGIARWNGAKWNTYGNRQVDEYGIVNAVALLPNGGLVIGGDFETVDKKPIANIAKWDGSQWTTLATGLNGPVDALLLRSNGELLVGGEFLTAASAASAYLGRWSDSGLAPIERAPQDVDAIAGDDSTFVASASAGYENVTYRWHRNGLPITEGPAGASFRGGTVLGASGAFGPITDGSLASLTIHNVRPSDAGNYTIVFTNDCGDVASENARLSVVNYCPADLDGNRLIDDRDLLMFASDYDTFACNDPEMPEFCLCDYTLDGLVDDSDFVIFARSYDQMICPALP